MAYINGVHIKTEILQGRSAYEIAVDNGFEGTEQEWLDSLGGGGSGGGGSADLSGYYNAEEVDALLDAKQDKKNIVTDYTSATEGSEAELLITNNNEIYISRQLTKITFNRDPDFDVGNQCYFSICSGASLEIADFNEILWHGDDCNDAGKFTPQPLTDYEISIKETIAGTVARVGAC